MFKTLVSLVLCVFLVLFYFEEKNSIISTFQLTEAPTIITKGHYGYSLIVELSYSHQGLAEWIATLHEPYPLFLIENDWMMRSPEIVKQLIEKNIEVGLLGSPNEQYEDSTLLEKQLAQFQSAFNQLPLWFATTDYNVTPALQKTLHDHGINTIAPSISITAPSLQLSDGEFISIPLHRGQSISFESINEFIQQHPFLSIEENIFGYKISTKRYP
ncbi:hypothetical protein DCE79_17645 [Lysinibacillus sp. 2017]|uniref:hypothetical protein n=1 Tax=unclassified Lysinibacillus TaxID=2636778 RepID=UPI000D52824A|nr:MULTISPECIES: hypothetical protein [unclassified Lysinibacillus]AWE09044.1 hypothetical protein DCE79_17645 [Lysinibacillus sp. 2017]TGN35869.1 hypothetical protein E4L99_06910 [Lysinibacillus sp. S2017]